MTLIVVDDAAYTLETLAIALRFAAHDAEGQESVLLLICALALDLAGSLSTKP